MAQPSDREWISKLPLTLTWRRRDDFSLVVKHNYTDHLRKTFDQRLARLRREDKAKGQSITQQYESLPEDSRLRFLTAPETYRRLIRRASEPVAAQADFISDSLRAERCRLREEPRLAEGVWSASGDYYFPASWASDSKDGTDDAVFKAPLITEHVVVDASSPYARISIPGDASEKTSHTPPEVRLILARLFETVDRIDEVAPYVRDFIDLVTRVIVLKKDQADPHSFGSSSWSSYIGKMALTNAHTEQINLARLANALAHEAIHSLLYMVELSDCFYLDEGAVCEFQVKSGWTGRTLYLASYLHACFVWFGLLNFWRLALECEGFTRSAADDCLSRAAKGFRSGDVLLPLKDIRQHLRPELLDAVQVLQDAVAGSYL